MKVKEDQEIIVNQAPGILSLLHSIPGEDNLGRQILKELIFEILPVTYICMFTSNTHIDSEPNVLYMDQPYK